MMKNIINISEALSLGLHGMGIVALSGRRMSVREIASQTGSSEAHLSKVFQRLARAGLILSTRGPGGGFVLSRSPVEITLFEIYRVIEGDPENGSCIMTNTVCPFRKCIFGGLLGRFNEEFLTHLREHTLEDLVKGKIRKPK